MLQPRPRRPRRRGHHPRLLSVTLDTLPARTAYYRYEVDDHHWLIVIRDEIEYGNLIRAYHRRLPAWARRRIYASYGAVDPQDDPIAAARMHWWDDGWLVTRAAASIAEGAHPGLITPWPHAWLLDPPA